MSKLRVLVIDDAVMIRRTVSDMLAGDPDIEVAGTSANGKFALAKIGELHPDLITVDVQNPYSAGMDTFRALRQSFPQLPSLMFSPLSLLAATPCLQLLASGPTDFQNRPASVGAFALGLKQIRGEMIPKVKQLSDQQAGSAAVKFGPFAPMSSAPQWISAPAVRPRAHGVEILVIGVSTGGPKALQQVIPRLPPDFPVPVLIVQHMPPGFTKLFSERLDSRSLVSVKEAEVGDSLEAGCVYVAPGDYHMTIEKGVNGAFIGLNQDKPENCCRPAVDVLFRSAALLYGPAALAVVLTGMGQDGCLGAAAIRQADGKVFVQDEASSAIWGMPGAIAKAQLAHKVIPLDQMVSSVLDEIITSRLKAGRSNAMQHS